MGLLRLTKAIISVCKTVTPVTGPFKGINRANKAFVRSLAVENRVVNDACMICSKGLGGFKELREAC